MDVVNIVLSGLGGQGILFMTRVLAQAGLNKGFEIMGAETHGMAQRGGSVVSHLRLGKVESSLVGPGKAHFLLALEENEAYRNLPFLRKAAGLYANVSKAPFPCEKVRNYLDSMRIRCRSLPAGELVMELKAPMALNLALLGFFSAFHEGPITHAELRDTVEQVSPDRFKALNLKVFDAGYQRGIQEEA